MCGIAGIITPGGGGLREDAERVLAGMLACQSHRGPDDEGTLLLREAGVALGHRRLSILDLSSAGHQPMVDGEGGGRLAMVFNGEIYNFRRLRAELVRSGARFRSGTDTEVLLHGYRAWGLRGMLAKLEGMFAFALHDAAAGRVHLVRDHFGIKPLYLAERGGTWAFSSEGKAVVRAMEAMGGRPAMDAGSLLLSLHHLGVPAPRTMWRGVEQLLPGTRLTIDLRSGQATREAYWSWDDDPRDIEVVDGREAPAILWRAIVASVEKHLESDVEVGVFLSSGLDSSLIAAACAELGRKPTCITIASDDPTRDESGPAAAFAKHYGLPHVIEPMDRAIGERFDPLLATIFDEPYAVTSGIHAAHLCEQARKHVKVALAGDGGDELFGGYKWYSGWLDMYGERGRRSLGDRLKRRLRDKGPPDDPVLGYAELIGSLTPRRTAGLFDAAFLRENAAEADPAALYRVLGRAPEHDRDEAALEAMLRWDRLQYLPNVCLPKMDRTGMAHGLEVRVPMVDITLARLVQSWATLVRHPDMELKGLLKRVAADRLPREHLGLPKRGFSGSSKRWFDPKLVRHSIAESHAKSTWWRGIFSDSLPRGLGRLSDREAWRFWHVWRWAEREAAQRSV